MCVGLAVSMVPKYAVITWNWGMGWLTSCGFGSAGVCTKAATRNVCLPQASAGKRTARARHRFIGSP